MHDNGCVTTRLDSLEAHFTQMACEKSFFCIAVNGNGLKEEQLCWLPRVAAYTVEMAYAKISGLICLNSSTYFS